MRKADNLPASCADCQEIWGPQPPGTLWAVQACNGTALPLHLKITLGIINDVFKFDVVLTVHRR